MSAIRNAKGGFQLNFTTFAIIPLNSDIAITALCSKTGVDVSAGFMGYFADIVS